MRAARMGYFSWPEFQRGAHTVLQAPELTSSRPAFCCGLGPGPGLSAGLYKGLLNSTS